MAGCAAILGGGIGGLTVANHLIRHGWDVTVFERSPGPPTTGTALGMWPQAMAALDAAGVGDGVRQLGTLQRRAAFLRPDGSVIGRVDSTRRTAYLISRPALLGVLLDGMPADVVRFAEPAPDLATLAEFDVVVAADGTRSATRDFLFGARYRPTYAGMTAWRGWIPGEAASVTETWGPGGLFGITPREGGLVNWFAAVRSPADSPGGLDFLRARFGDWHQDIRKILEQVGPDVVLHHDLYESPALPSYVRGNVALIGDAAHSMAPNLGRGACEAMVDAVTLGRLLTERAVPDALGRYDRARRRPTRRLVRASHLVGRVATAERWIGLRDSVVGLGSRFA
ncbi:2-polyprenyl-6-methoxyphenol hydroxylase-like FAD-dependent oxidoreductase [Rhodococcus sp. OK519]|uniref:FAD-dependent oxidoreductase n=1 Tax=Rhodococcus sp. OK519 TaxID=2135729 RepID=UPI000D3A4FEF|nr:2-polyprenyl-6-methoxyphenol hydroxylase-like FAD-dependent oxidoreductase [Rhodococcus sp. OK519]